MQPPRKRGVPRFVACDARIETAYGFVLRALGLRKSEERTKGLARATFLRVVERDREERANRPCGRPRAARARFSRERTCTARMVELVSLGAASGGDQSIGPTVCAELRREDVERFHGRALEERDAGEILSERARRRRLLGEARRAPTIDGALDVANERRSRRRAVRRPAADFVA